MIFFLNRINKTIKLIDGLQLKSRILGYANVHNFAPSMMRQLYLNLKPSHRYNLKTNVQRCTGIGPSLVSHSLQDYQIFSM